jgi:hypothetical protein
MYKIKNQAAKLKNQNPLEPHWNVPEIEIKLSKFLQNILF